MTRTNAFRLLLASATMLAGGAVVATPAAAQTTTASVRGRVIDANGPVAGATVTAVNTGTNRTSTATADANGNYSINGLTPSSYRFTATATGGRTTTTRADVSVGQAATLDLDLSAPAAATADATTTGRDVVVTGTRLIETKTSEVATNVSRKQIESLPQSDRNFLSFAALAPGVNYQDSSVNNPTSRRITSGASTASQVNVFIDGVSQKNQTLDGGIAGQQDSRGNPFSQLAVQEFRVLTQNYKAEYEQAGAAIVTAVTKSGTNEFHGEIFGQYTGKGLSEKDYFAKVRGFKEPEFTRKQYGASLGGPIIKDRLFFFGTFEGNDQKRANTVTLGNRSAANLAQFGQYEGQFVSPFRERLYFGKLTFTPDDHQRFDLSYSRREESDIRAFGGQTAYTQAENGKNKTETYEFKWTYTGGDIVNEFLGSRFSYIYNPTSLSPSTPSYVYRGVISFGGKNGSQKVDQTNWTLRDDLTYSGFDHHVIKGGARVNVVDYTFNKLFYVAPEYTYILDATRNQDYTTPSEVRLGLGNPRLGSSDTQVGAYIQDDWDVTDRLQLNLGLRWDYETNMYNNDFVTPLAARAVLTQLPQTSYFHAADYISDGNRKPYWKMFQPRVGFSYDFSGDRRTVLFGGYGRYYDRNVFNNTLDELYRTQYQVGTFFFSKDGKPRDGNPTLVWDPSYASAAALLALRASAVTGQPELFAVPGNAEPPRTDQFSLGLRQKVGIFQVSATGSYIIGRNGYTTLFATRTAAGQCCDTTIPRQYGYSNALIGYPGLDTRYKGLFITVDKPYTDASGWGLNIAYTLSKAEQDGNDLFSLDAPTPRDYGYRPTPGDQRHKLVISGIAALPYGFQFSALTTLGSGQAFAVTDASRGSSSNFTTPTSRYPTKNCIKGVFAYCEVNTTLEKDFRLFNTHTLGLAVDLLNVFNNKNFSGYGGYIGVGQTGVLDNTLQQVSSTTTTYIQPTDLLTLPRRIQFRAFYRF